MYFFYADYMPELLFVSFLIAYDEFNSLSLVPLNEIKHHRSCYKAYASKGKLQRFVSDVPECSNTSNDASVSTMKTRSGLHIFRIKEVFQLAWSVYYLCLIGAYFQQLIFCFK
jgi:hypothetical protein